MNAEERRIALVQDSYVEPELYAESVKPRESMKNAAKRGLEAREKANKSNKCCTPTGLARANQLASGENLSLETLKRMRDFFTRHRKNAKPDESLVENKGNQAIAMWGAMPNQKSIDSALSWLEGKINKLEGE